MDDYEMIDKEEKEEKYFSRDAQEKQETQNMSGPTNSLREFQTKQKQADQQMAHHYQQQHCHDRNQTQAGRGNHDGPSQSHHSHHHPDALFKVLFVKCPLEECDEFALNTDGIKRHLFIRHGIFHRCIATERCVRREVNFSVLSNLHKHLEQEHLSYYDGYKCYMCNAVFRFYNELERHFLFNHEEGHFACALCPQNHFTQEGYRKYFFSGKYRREVLEHCAQVHNNSGHDGRLMPPPPPPPPKPFFGK